MTPDFAGAELHNANLSGADLTAADLRRAALIGASLTDADLRSADLTKATLFTANVDGTSLRNAVVSEVISGYCVFAGVSLDGIRGLDSIVHLGPSTIGIDTLERTAADLSKYSSNVVCQTHEEQKQQRSQEQCQPIHQNSHHHSDLRHGCSFKT